MFKKLNKLQKVMLRMKDNEAYKNYKFELGLQHLPPLPSETYSNTDVHFKHSGNAGDIIYSLPSIFALAKNRNIHLHLSTAQRSNNESLFHPLGSVMLTENMVDLLRPLLLYQTSMKSLTLFKEQKIDYDLDLFRQYPFNYKTGNIARWYFLAFGINADLGRPGYVRRQTIVSMKRL